MRVTAHVGPDGSIRGLVIQPEGNVTAMMMPEPGDQIVELPEHGLGETFDIEKVEALRNDYKVTVTPPRGDLIRRKQAAE